MDGKVQSDTFSDAEIERGRRYHRPRYAAGAAGAGLGFGALAALAWLRPSLGLAWWLEAPALAALAVAGALVVRLPLAYWIGHLRERAWQLTDQDARGWAADRAKGLLVAVVLAAAPVTGLVALARWLPSAWPAAAAAAAALLVVMLGFLAPLVLEPVFNRFRPLGDDGLTQRLLRLAERAGAPVREVLVADASRRTRKLNAYVSGLGASRRVVLFDTLLAGLAPDEVAIVVAHELAHRRERHVAKMAAATAAGAAATIGVLYGALGDAVADPRNVPLVLLVAAGLQLVAAPLAAAVSRRHERVADRIALSLTQDPDAFVALFHRLAEANVADLDPPRLVRALATHPPVPERVAAAGSFARLAR